MTMLRPLSIVICFISLLVVFPASADDLENSEDAARWIISSGAFTNLPAGSLVSIAVALERGIQAIKFDLVLSKDDQVMVLSDPRLNDLTNVDRVFPDRVREDGSYYSIDFTREELKGLVYQQERAVAPPAGTSAVFTPDFPVISLYEALGYIDLIVTNPAHKPVIIGELRKGWLHRREGKELARSVYSLLDDFRVRSENASLFLASYDPEELQQLADERSPAVGMGSTDIKLIQLIGTNDGAEVKTLDFGHYQPYNYDLLFTKFGLKAISTYAAAIGLKPLTIFNDTGEVTRASYLEDARTLGIDLILYGEAANLQFDRVPDSPPSTVLDHLFTTVGFDAVLTDDADLLSNWTQPTEEPAGDENQDNTIERLIRQIERSSTEQPSSPQSGKNW